MTERLRELINYYISSGKVKSDAEFARYISKSPTVLCGMLSGKRVISDKALRLIVSAFPEVNYEWLATGKGEMLRPAEQPAKTPEPSHFSPVSSVELLKGTAGFDPKYVERAESRVKYNGENSQANDVKGMVYEDDFKAVCNENTELKLKNARMRRKMFELMEKLAKLGYPCEDNDCAL